MKQAIRRRSGLAGLAAATMLSLMASAPAQAGPAEDCALAEKEFARGDLVVSVALWTKAAEQGYAPAQARLGDVLDKSEQDDEAVAWYTKAAAQGNAAGQYGLAQMYLKGEGVKKDLEQARLHAMRAAEQGHPDATMQIMNAYRSGALGLARDAAQADAWELKVKALFPGYTRSVPNPKGKPGKAK